MSICNSFSFYIFLCSRFMVTMSWVISIILALPQAFMFRKLKHPEIEFYQCTTTMAIEDSSYEVLVDGQKIFLFLGFDPETIYRFYHFSFLFFVFFLPFSVLIVNYIIIIKLIKRYMYSIPLLH